MEPRPPAADVAGDGIDSNCDGEDTRASGAGDGGGGGDGGGEDGGDGNDKGGCAAAPVGSGLGLVFLSMLGLVRRRRAKD